MDEFEEKTIQTNQIFKGKIIDLQVDDVQLPDGSTSKREIVKHPGAVAILAITESKKFIMVEQYRKPLEKSIIEIPAGKLEPNEPSSETALRELEEETGYTAEEVEYIMSYYTSPGFADEKMELFVAKGLKKLETPVSGDEDEFLSIHYVSKDDALQLIKEERIHDAKTIHAIYYAIIEGMVE